MTVDTTFGPSTPCYLVGTSAVQVAPKDLSSGVATYRVRCLATAYLTWGSTASVVAAGAPSAGVPSPATVGMLIGTVMYLQLPPGSFFISNTAASFEISGGQGGAGGSF